MNAVVVCRWWHQTKAGEEYRSIRLNVAGVAFYAIDVPLADVSQVVKALEAQGVWVTFDPPGNTADGYILPPEYAKPDDSKPGKPTSPALAQAVKAVKAKPVKVKPVAADDVYDF